MSFREWLAVVGVFIILGILLDGYRRMRLAKMDSLKMSRDMGGNLETSPLDDDFNPELPAGGARVVLRDGEELLKNEAADVLPEQLEVNDESDAISVRQEPTITDSAARTETLSSSHAELDSLDAVDTAHIELSADQGDRVGAATPLKADKPIKDIVAKKRPKASQDKSKNRPPSNSDSKREVIVINVDAKNEAAFGGSDVKHLLEACGLEHGDMSIFHRHEEDDLLSPIQFSVANAVEPGYFDPQTLDSVSTPGVSFFMSLPGPKDYMKAFDYMLETAQCFAKNLNGELRDEQRSVMTTQTIEHCRQRVREFERKRLSQLK